LLLLLGRHVVWGVSELSVVVAEMFGPAFGGAVG
jgi:hypothetical protein